MAPLPTPEERRKRLQSIGLDDFLGRKREGIKPPGRQKSAAQAERDEQRQEARRRGSPRKPR